MTTGLFGNSLTIAAVLKVESLRKVGNSFIVSLAVADLLVACVVMPCSVAYDLSTTGILSADSVVLFSIYGTVDVTLTTASILSITCISVDRYIAIMDPLRYSTRMRPKVAAVMIMSTWGVSLLNAQAPQAVNLLMGFGYTDAFENCCSSNRQYLAMIVTESLVFFVACAGMLVVYAMIFHEVRKTQAAQISAHDATRRTTSLKAAKTLGLVTGMFLLCWLPDHILYIVSFPIKSVPQEAFAYVAWLAYLNSALNPVIYAVNNREFRRAFKAILRKRPCCIPDNST
jgi:hypothetical protein